MSLELQKRLNNNVKENVLLAQYTTFRIGGPAKYFYVAENSQDIIKAVQAAIDLKIPYFILGSGSNVLVSDKGFAGLVIKIHNSSFIIHDSSVTVGAGVSNAVVAKTTVDAGLTGLEWIVGVPGTIGGSVRGNAGCFGAEIKNVVRAVKVCQVSGVRCQVSEFAKEDCEFDYRDSIFKHDPNLIILEVKLKLKKGDRAEGEKKIKEILKKRGASQPKGLSSGCIFKNYELGIMNQELLRIFPRQYIDLKKIPAGWIIEQLGLKGFVIGGAKISEEHGNFIINTGNATAENIIMLISLIKEKARNNFGIQLEEEIQLVGF